jgi:hypothetical protein
MEAHQPGDTVVGGGTQDSHEATLHVVPHISLHGREEVAECVSILEQRAVRRAKSV